MQRAFLFAALFLASTKVTCQFYPASDGAWCMEDDNWLPQALMGMEMSHEPDTLILGQSYKVIREYHGGLYRRHYVRSAPDGKGYVFLMDSLAEYLTGDTAALAGDTVHNVLVWNEDLENCPVFGFNFMDVIVDSVVVLSSQGVSITRQYCHSSCHDPSGVFDPFFFWQAGLGTSAGPYLQVRSFGAVIAILCAVVQGVTVCGTQISPDGHHQGMPGGPPCCIANSAVPEHAAGPSVRVAPNPSPGVFKFEGSGRWSITVVDAEGRVVLKTS